MTVNRLAATKTNTVPVRDSDPSKLYNRRWRRARHYYLLAHPLCVMCNNNDNIKQAQVVDHITPHKGDYALFWDSNNWQSLCKPCHDKHKQRLECGWSNSVNEVDRDGWPTDPRHPSHDRNFFSRKAGALSRKNSASRPSVSALKKS